MGVDVMAPTDGVTLRAFDPISDAAAVRGMDTGFFTVARFEVRADGPDLALQVRRLPSPLWKRFPVDLTSSARQASTLAVRAGRHEA
jgi:hypothetical protein